MTKIKTYDGPSLEKGGTSTRFRRDTLTPALARLIKSGALDGVDTILDYGAGRYGRNAKVLRQMGFRVYAYDLFHGEDVDGWEGVSSEIPRNKFDLGFTSFVLNVVPLHMEKEILKYMDDKCKKHYHVVRDDIIKMIRKALARGDKHVTHFFLHLYASPEEKGCFDQGKIYDNTLLKFSRHGTKTSRGFQRLCTCENQGLTLIDHKTGSWKLYGS